MAEPTIEGKAQGATHQLFIEVLVQANIPEDFFKEILIKKRIHSFRTAMSLDDDQYEDLRALVEKSNDEGFKMDFLQFRKLMNAGKYYIIKNYEKKVPWETFDTDMTLDLIDEYMEFRSDKDREDAVSPVTESIQEADSTKTEKEDVTLSYAKRSLKPFESLKFPPKPIMYTDMKSWKRRFHNILRSMNLEYLIENNFKAPEKGDKEYDQFLYDSKFLYSVLVEQVMNPDHEARHGLFTRDVDNRGDLAYVKLINTYDNETIEKSLRGRLYNKWMSLRLSVVNQGAAKTYIMNYSALLDEMSDEGSPIDSTAAKVVFLEHITHPEYRTVVVDLSEDGILEKFIEVWYLKTMQRHNDKNEWISGICSLIVCENAVVCKRSKHRTRVIN